MLISKYIEHGAKLFWYQHGAFYGEFTGHNAHYHESSVADEFRTWGWKIRDNDVPWKAYRLEQFRMQYEMEKKEKRYDCLMCYSALYAGNISFYTSVTNYFLENIDPNKYRQILARPRPIHKLHSQAFQLSFIADERVIKDSALGNMTEAIAQSKIVIQFSVPSTNFLECFYVNHPTIGVLNNIEPTLIIKKYYDFFIEMGVLHKDFTSLVNHLNSIKIDEWWQEVILHPVFKSFKNEFLNNRMDL
jgi:putative transferase (TIGR04331 family)